MIVHVECDSCGRKYHHAGQAEAIATVAVGDVQMHVCVECARGAASVIGEIATRAGDAVVAAARNVFRGRRVDDAVRGLIVPPPRRPRGAR